MTGPSSSSVFCSKHFEQDCFVVEGIRFRESMGIPAKRLNAVPTIFSRPTHGESSKSSTPCKRTAYEKRQRKTIVDEVLSTSRTITDIDSSRLSSTAEPHNPTSVQEPPTKRSRPVNLLKGTSTDRPDLQ